MNGDPTDSGFDEPFAAMETAGAVAGRTAAPAERCSECGYALCFDIRTGTHRCVNEECDRWGKGADPIAPEATLQPVLETGADGQRTQIAGRPGCLTVEGRKALNAIFGALDLRVSRLIRDGMLDRQTAPGALHTLQEFRELVQCWDLEFGMLLTPDNTLEAMKGVR